MWQHGTKSCPKITQIHSVIGALIWELRLMSIKLLYFKNGRTNLWLHILTDASKEAMCIVAFFQDETILKLTSVIGKCRVAPIRHTTIPKWEPQAAVFGVRLSTQISRDNWQNLSLDRFTYGLTVVKSAHKKKQVFIAIRAADILENSSMDQWRHVKGIENRADIGTRGTSIEDLKGSGCWSGPA